MHTKPYVPIARHLKCHIDFRVHRCRLVQIYSPIIDIGQICRFSYAFWPLSSLSSKNITDRLQVFAVTLVLSQEPVQICFQFTSSKLYIRSLDLVIHMQSATLSRFCRLVHRLILLMHSFITCSHSISFCHLQYWQSGAWSSKSISETPWIS